ncbi:ceramide phosphoethanolamine synthase [Neocloeon triangulifer]|uniref:ceramide phosphoethanolamine synthase n=1 Tax=Neocloeon triangulifer TaxID=2078957 RepID=UPI00286F8AD2|nr:ceramide phosphoethanolamine synthase [Neocloeon triangulifer]
MALNLWESKVLQLMAAGLLLFYVWMDVALYYQVQALPVSNGKGSATSSSSPFAYVTMKALLLDHTTHYVHTPLAVWFNSATNFAEVFTWITANMVSFSHVVVAVVGMKLLWSDSLSTRQLGVLLFEVRSFLDAFDGTLARARAHSSLEEPGIGSSGHLIDGACDALGCIALFLGCLGILRRKPPPHYSALPGPGGKETRETLAQSNRRAITIVGCAALQMTLSSLFWNRTLMEYHDLLEVPGPTYSTRVIQNTVFKSSALWITVWFWRLTNPHAMMELILISIFLDKLWHFLTWIQYIGFVILLVQVSITETHLHYVEDLIPVVNASMMTPLSGR